MEENERKSGTKRILAYSIQGGGEDWRRGGEGGYRAPRFFCYSPKHLDHVRRVPSNKPWCPPFISLSNYHSPSHDPI